MQNAIFNFITFLWMNIPVHWNFQAVSERNDNPTNLGLKTLY